MEEVEAIARRIADWRAGEPRGPWTLELYPTLRCNLSCLFCDTGLRRHPPAPELPAERQLALVDEAAELGVRRLFLLGGGEPLVAPFAPELMLRAKAHGMEGVLTTNGTLLDPRLQDALLDAGWDEIHVSLDAPRAAVHDHLRGSPGAFRRAVSALCRLRHRREALGLDRPRLAIHFVLTRLNHRSLPDMVRLASAVGAERVDFDALVAYRPEQRALLLEPGQRAELPAIAAEALELARERGIATTLEHLLDPGNLEREAGASRDLLRGVDARDPWTRAPCLRAWHYLVVQSDGRTSPCCVLAGTGDSLSGRSLVDLWLRSPWLQALRAEMLAGRPHPRCGECSANILSHERAIQRRLLQLIEAAA